jgi:hypothetical protein
MYARRRCTKRWGGCVPCGAPASQSNEREKGQRTRAARYPAARRTLPAQPWASRPHTKLSFRRSAARNLSLRQTWCATEKSALRFLVARREPRAGPVRPWVRPRARRGLPRLTTSNPTADSSALRPVVRETDGSMAGPRNDRAEWRTTGFALCRRRRAPKSRPDRPHPFPAAPFLRPEIFGEWDHPSARQAAFRRRLSGRPNAPRSAVAPAVRRTPSGAP